MGRAYEKEQAVLDFIRDGILRHGYPPSVREICTGVGLSSTSSVHAHLNHLEEKGLIRRDPAKPRALEVIDGSIPRGRCVPLVGRVTAGMPLLAEENIEDTLALPQELENEPDLFALRVQGESMIEAGILDGDIVIVREQSEASNGEIIVAMIEDDATMKRVFYENGHVRLQPENRYMEPIIVPEIRVVGKVIALYRRF